MPQDSGQTAASLFASGQYTDAAKMYELAASVASSQTQKIKYYDMSKKCRLCASYSAEANSLAKQGKYDAAEASYRKILEINPNDASIDAKIRKIAGQRESVFFDRHDYLQGKCAEPYNLSSYDFYCIDGLLARYDCWDEAVVLQCISLLKKNKPKKI